MKRKLRITSVKAVSPGVLLIGFDGKEPVRVDLATDIAEYKALAPLADWERFRRARADPWGHAVRWTKGIDLGADSLWLEAQVQAGMAVRFEEFDAWRKRNNLSLSDIARILGVTRRTATNYASGLHAIPKVVGLAMIGWEALLNKKAA